MNRLGARSLMEISQVQYGSMPDRESRNALFLLRRLGERSIQKQNDVLTCFIDYRKALDTVKHASLFDLLSSLDIESHDIKLLANLYWNQQAAVRHNGEVSEISELVNGSKLFPMVEQVNSCIYLGSMFTSDGRCVQDIRRRIGIAKSAFTSLEKVLKSRDIKLQLRIRVLK